MFINLVEARRWRSLAIAAGALVALLSLAGLLATPASAAPTSGLVFSIDGGATWSANVNAAPGQTVLARAFYDNDGTRAITNSSVTTTLPSGFALVPGSTRVCLSPGATPTSPSTEQVCDTDGGQTGPINEAAVWTGTSLTISPTAGLFGQSNAARTGILAKGEKRYVSLVNCDYQSGTEHYTTSITTTFLNSWLQAGTAATNTAAVSASCGPGALTYALDGQNSGVQNIPLLGRRYLIVQNCDYLSGTDNYTASISTMAAAAKFGAGTSSSNSSPATATCGPGGAGYAPVPANSGTQSLNLLTNRYVQLDNCTYTNAGDYYTDSIATTPSAVFRAGTKASNAANIPVRCGSGGSHAIAPLVSGVQSIDLGDRARGQGFVQFAMKAPSPPATTTYHQSGQLIAAGTSNPVASGTITINVSLGTPWGDPALLLSVALIGVAAGLHFAMRRVRARSPQA